MHSSIAKRLALAYHALATVLHEAGETKQAEHFVQRAEEWAEAFPKMVAQEAQDLKDSIDMGARLKNLEAATKVAKVV